MHDTKCFGPLVLYNLSEAQQTAAGTTTASSSNSDEVDFILGLLAALGEWRPVKLARRSPRDLDSGDCELVEQFDRELLPFFAIRNRQEKMSCMPHHVSEFGIDLSFEALAPLPKATTAEPTK